MNFLKSLFLSSLLLISQCALCQQKDTTITSHSPSKAMLYSVFCPGLGQVYNRQVWKVPIIYAGMTTAIYFAVYNHSRANKFKKEYLLRDSGVQEGRRAEYANYPDESIYSLY